MMLYLYKIGTGTGTGTGTGIGIGTGTGIEIKIKIKEIYMKCFGKKSLSSLLSIILRISWYIVLGLSILAFLLGAICMLSKECRNQISAEILKSVCNMNSADQKDFEELIKFPLALKLVIVPYFGAFVVILLQIIRKSQQLFTNFKNDIVFYNSNALIILNISKLNIAFSVMTFNFALLLISILLYMLCEIFKKGSSLQEEHDYTA